MGYPSLLIYVVQVFVILSKVNCDCGQVLLETQEVKVLNRRLGNSVILLVETPAL